MKTVEEIKAHIKVLEQQYQYLSVFLSTIHRGRDTRNRVQDELTSLDREIKVLRWVVYDSDDLPY